MSSWAISPPRILLKRPWLVCSRHLVLMLSRLLKIVSSTLFRVTTLIVASLLAATSLAFAGIIGFIGLVGQHVARMLVGEEQRFFAPALMAAGAMLMAVAHAVSITVMPGIAVLLGIITSLVGVPFFLVLLFSRRQVVWGGPHLPTLVAIHDLNLAARYCDELVVLLDGEIVAQGKPAEVLSSELLEHVYGFRAKVLYDEGVPVISPVANP